MKKNITIIFILIGQICSFSQTFNDEKLISAFGEKRYSYLKEQLPDSLTYYYFVLNDGFDIMLKKYVNVEQLSEATSLKLPSDWIENGIPQKSKINIFLLPVQFHHNSHQYYLIEETDYVLRTKPLNYINRKFQSRPNK